ncbi:MAG: DUF3102 domain-containing protein [bacterium]
MTGHALVEGTAAVARRDFDLDAETEAILELKRGIARNFLEIGRRLIRVRERIPHGEFGRWLGESVGLSWSMANKLMKIARELPNSESIPNLGIWKAYALLRIPPHQREEFLSRGHNVNGKGGAREKSAREMSSREFRRAVDEWLERGSVGADEVRATGQSPLVCQQRAMDHLRKALAYVNSDAFGNVSPPVGDEFLRLLGELLASLGRVGVRGEIGARRHPPHCSVCGRELADVESISRGMGPECFRRFARNM